MKRAIASALLLFCSSSVSWAASFTDFEDLLENTNFPVGSTISSQGLSFEVVPYPSPTGRFISGIAHFLEPEQTTLLSTGSAGLEFIFPADANHISFDYSIGFPGASMVINGIVTANGNTLDFLDGTIVGGVLVSLATPMSPIFEGRLVLSGGIDSFVIGGVEFSVDNVRVNVPEPSTLALLLFGVTAMALRR